MYGQVKRLYRQVALAVTFRLGPAGFAAHDLRRNLAPLSGSARTSYARAG